MPVFFLNFYFPSYLIMVCPTRKKFSGLSYKCYNFVQGEWCRFRDEIYLIRLKNIYKLQGRFDKKTKYCLWVMSIYKPFGRRAHLPESVINVNSGRWAISGQTWRSEITSGAFHHKLYQVSKAHFADLLVLFPFVRKIEKVFVSCITHMNLNLKKLA